MSDRYTVLHEILGDRFDEFKSKLQELAKSTLADSGKTRLPLTDTVYQAKEDIRQALLKEIKAQLHEEISENSILSKVELVLRDERQSSAGANVSLTEAAKDYGTVDSLPFYAVEDGGGRYGADAHMNNNYELPIDANRKIYDAMPNTMSSILIRNSVMIGYRKYPAEAQQLIAEGMHEPLEDTKVTGELRHFGAVNAIADAGPAIRSVADGRYFNIRNEFSQTISTDPNAYSLEKAANYLSWTVDASIAATLDFTRVTSYAQKDFSGRTPPNREVEEKTFGNKFNAVPVDEFFVKMNEVLPPHMLGVYHGHNTLGDLGYGINTSIAALQNGAAVATFSISPSSTLAHPDLLEFLDRPEAKELGNINKYERGLIEVVGLIEENFHHVRNATKIVKDVSDDSKQGVGRTGAPGGGLANIDKGIEKNTQNLDYAKKVLSTKYNGETVDFSKMGDDEIRNAARDRMTVIYFDVLEDYRQKVGGPALVTPFYKYVNDLVQENITAVMKGENQTLADFDVIKDSKLMLLTDDARNMVTGRTDRMPIKPDPILTERAFDKFYDVALDNIRKDIAYKNNIPPSEIDNIQPLEDYALRRAATSIGSQLNRGMDEAFDVVAAEEHLRDVRTINKKISQNRVNFGDLPAEMIGNVTKYYIEKEKALVQERDAAVKNYADVVRPDVKNYSVAEMSRMAKAHYDVEKAVLGKDKNAVSRLEKFFEGSEHNPVNSIMTTKFSGIEIPQADLHRYMLDVIASRMEVKTNPLDAENYRRQDAQQALDYAKKGGMVKHVSDSQALHIYALGQVRLVDSFVWDKDAGKYDKRKTLEQPFNFFSPVSFVDMRGRTVDMLNEMKDNLLSKFPGDADIRMAIKGVFNSDFTAYATGVRVGNPMERVAKPIIQQAVAELLVQDLKRIGYDFDALDKDIGHYGKVSDLLKVSNPKTALKGIGEGEREKAVDALKITKAIQSAIGKNIHSDVLHKNQTHLS